MLGVCIGSCEQRRVSKVTDTLRASLSGAFLQTLPDLVTPLKGTLYLRAAVQRRGQRPPKGLGTHPPLVKKRKDSVSIQTILVLFELA